MTGLQVLFLLRTDTTSRQLFQLSHCQRCTDVHLCAHTFELNPNKRIVMTWIQHCVIEMDDLFYYLWFECMCLHEYAPRALGEHIVTLVVFGHQRPHWQRLKWWLRTGGLDGKMWINEAQIELIAMTSHNSGAAKWEYVVGAPQSLRLFHFQGESRSTEGEVTSPSLFTRLLPAWQDESEAVFHKGQGFSLVSSSVTRGITFIMDCFSERVL